MDDYVLNELKASIRGATPPLVICGAGVSVQATDGQAPSWNVLIESGIERAEDIAASSAWAAYARERLRGNNVEAWITVADEVTDHLGGSGGGEFRRWLDDKFKNLRATDMALLNALASLGCPIATTNYDDVLSQGLGLPAINWNDYDNAALFLKGERKGILHLHGHWSKPETVVLGTKSYANLIGKPRRTILQQLGVFTRPSLFVGCGDDGLSDPDYEQLDAFLWEWSGSAERRFWLIRGETAAARALTNLDRNLLAVAYGTEFHQLPSFLSELRLSRPQPPERASVELRTIDLYEPEPKLFGRDAQQEAVTRSLLNGEHVIISGAPGAGKTALAVVSLYDAGVRAKFGDRRLFVSLDGIEEARSIVASLADAMGLGASGDIPSLLRQIDLYSRSSPIVAIIDNAEGVFDNDYYEAERVLNLLAQCRSVSLVVTLRGVAPKLARSLLIDDLSKLEVQNAARAFLEIAGEKFTDDPHLAGLLTALDGHPLSIQLMAAQAKGLSRLQSLQESWEEERASILRLRGQEEGRLTSVRASLALSLKTNALRREPFAKRLLGALALLPDGVAEADVRDILGERGKLPQFKVRHAIMVIRDLRLVEPRIDNRLRMLNPLRESLQGLVVANSADRSRITKRGWALATKGKFFGTPKWAEIRPEMDAEANNMELACRVGISSSPIGKDLIEAIGGLAKYAEDSGASYTTTFQQTVSQLIKDKNYSWAGALLTQMGLISYSRSEYSKSFGIYQQALLYIGNNPNNRCNILRGMARTEMFRSNHHEAERLLLQALDISTRAKDTLNSANNQFHLAHLALRRGNLHEASKITSQSLKAFQQCAGIIGEANCLVAQARIDDKDAEGKLRHAISLFESVNSPASLSLARIYYGEYLCRQGNYDEGLALYERAQLDAQVGASLDNEAWALVRRGMWQQVLDPNGSDALEFIDLGFKLWFQVMTPEDRAYSGWISLFQGLMTSSANDRKRFLAEAEACWLNIERFDLIRDCLYFDRPDWPLRPSPTPPPS